MELEQHLSQINENIFFKEFSFSRNKFSPPQETELQFADHVVWLDELLMTFQVKARELSGTRTQETEITWFKKKVLGLATKQIRDTLRYLSTYDEIDITNERGHVFNVVAGKTNQPIHVVSYSPHDLLPAVYRRKKFHFSKTAGFIHLIPVYDWMGICQALITPAEIAEYLAFRQSISVKHESRVNRLAEQALLGQFLYGTLEAEPDTSFTRYLRLFVLAHDEFDMSHILRMFADRIVKTIQISPTCAVAEEHQYYQILKELAKLSRNEMKAVKFRYDLCIEKCKASEFELPYRITSPRTGCGFVFIVVTKDHVPTTVNALKNFTYAHKYDQNLDKCIGISFARDGEYYDVGWCYLEKPWTHDGEMEQKLREHFPLGRSKRK